jgi:carbonic anhydrase
MINGQRWAIHLLAAASLAIVIGTVAYWRVVDSQPATASQIPASPDTALAELRSGNARFVNSARILSTDTDHDAEYRRQTSKQQHPFAVILCCADSRVCPEFIFDQRPGCIFEIRNAGNVVDEDVLASFEYAVEHLHVPLILVLAHEGCGAIAAVCEAGEKPLHDHLKELQKHMPGIRKQILANHDTVTPELLNGLSKENAKEQALALIRDSDILKTAVDEGHARLMCGLYDMETGMVEFFDPR